MIKSEKFVSGFVLSVCLTLLAGCSSSVQKADIPNTANPQTEITKFDEMLAEATSKNVDVLAPDEFQSSLKMFQEAKSDLASGQKQDEILNDVRVGRGHLTKAYSVAEPRRGNAPGLFEARQMALNAGANKRPELKSELKSLDDDVSDKADKLSKLSSDKIAKFQERYIQLERRAVVLTQLGRAQSMLNGAEKDNATSKAPSTYKKTELALKNAESVISTNVRNPGGYEKSVADANRSAELLSDVMMTVKQNKNLSETAALKMVSQNRQIKNLKTEMNDSASANAAQESALEEKNEKLESDLQTTNKSLDNAKASVEIQQAIEKARSQFSSDEAEAYQQGGTLLIRMKKMNFSSGRSELPEASLASLAKVSEVAKSLNATSIKVEGHTDSTGTESQNMAISESRARAVAAYLKSNGFNEINVQSTGYGFQKPIATNKSKEGRTQNRRVDIVITPNGSTTDIQ